MLHLAADQRDHAGAAHAALAGVVHRDAGVQQGLQQRLALFDLDRDAGLQALGGEPIYFMAEKEMFVPMLIISAIWKEIGWGSVVYLAALSGINAEIADAAAIDGASRLQKIIYIFIPAIFPTIAIMLIMRMGTILDSGFDQIFNLYSPATYDVADVLDTYVYRMGVQGYQYGFSTAVGLFKSVVGIIMVLVTNTISKKLSEGEISI